MSRGCRKRHTPTTAADLVHKRRFPAEVEDAIESFRRQFGGVLDDIREDLSERIVQAGPTDAETVAELVIAEHEDAVIASLKEGGREGVDAGRRMASRRFGLDIDFGQEPTSAIEAVEDVVDSFADDSLDEMATRVGSDLEGWLEEGLGVDDIADRIQSRDYGQQLQDRGAPRPWARSGPGADHHGRSRPVADHQRGAGPRRLRLRTGDRAA